MNEDVKMRPAETVLRMEGKEVKNDGGDESN
jgi:hypothetical protein